jgi:hypothetical protein
VPEGLLKGGTSISWRRVVRILCSVLLILVTGRGWNLRKGHGRRLGTLLGPEGTGTARPPRTDIPVNRSCSAAGADQVSLPPVP